ncbi:MAG: FmdB family zinc ribbon protein [Anaerolineales bacterium]
MPAYEYNCLDCKRRFEIFMSYSEYGNKDINCTHCGSANIQRRLSRIRIAKSEDSRMENLAGNFDDPAALAGLEEDPQALGRMMRKMSREMGEDLGPEFDEVVDRLEKGQSPEDIEAALPDLGGDDAGMGGMGGGLDDFDDF